MCFIYHNIIFNDRRQLSKHTFRHQQHSPFSLKTDKIFNVYYINIRQSYPFIMKKLFTAPIPLQTLKQLLTLSQTQQVVWHNPIWRYTYKCVLFCEILE
jgi:hypothetical protein